MKVLDLPETVQERRLFGFFDDFDWYLSPHRWTSLAADSGASVAAGSSAVGGTIVLTTGATNNNEVAAATTNKPFTIAADKPLFFETQMQYNEAATSAANVFAGFSSVLGTPNMLLDDGAGPAASFSGAGIFKVDGGTVWNCVSSIGSAQTVNTSSTTAGGASPQVLRIEIQPIDSVYAEVTYFVDGVALKDANGFIIKQNIVYASAAAMQAGFYVKAGGANSEVVNVDYVAAYQLR